MQQEVSIQHAATFVFDSALPVLQYAKLVEAEGVIHKLVQRLIEKHGKDASLRLSLLVTNSERHRSARKVYRAEYLSPTIFLASLPKLTRMFLSKRQLPPKWPAFGQKDMSGERIKDRKRKRIDQVNLLDGVVKGLELLEQTQSNRQLVLSKTFISLTPSSAMPLLDYISGLNHKTTDGPQKYLVMVAANTLYDSEVLNGVSAVVNDNWDSGWDGRGWKDLVGEIKKRDIKCSCVIVRSPNDEVPANRIKTLCQDVMETDTNQPWFPIPPGVDLLLSGYNIRPRVTLTPPLPFDMPSTIASTTTTATNPLNASDANSANKINPRLARVFAQAQAASQGRSIFNPAVLAKLDSQLIANMLAAVKVQNVQNPSETRWMQIQQLLEAQQWARAQNVQNQGQSKVDTTEENAMAIMQQQRAQQAQVPAPSKGGQAAMLSRSSTVWSGPFTWGPQSSGAGLAVAVNVDAQVASGNSDTVLSSQWPKELSFHGLAVLNFPALTEYAKQKFCPVVAFIPQDRDSNGPANIARYTQLSASLGAKSNMVVIPFPSMGADKGLLIFAAPISGGRSFRLMGILCVNVPFPPLQLINPRSSASSVQSQRTSSHTGITPTLAAAQPAQATQSAMQQPLHTQIRPSPVLQQGMVNNLSGNFPSQQLSQNQQQQYNLFMQQQAQSRQNMAGPGQPLSQPPSQPAVAPATVPTEASAAQATKGSGITVQQYNQIMNHAKKLGFNIPAFDPATISHQKLQNLVQGLRMAEVKQRLQQVQAQQAQAQQGGQTQHQQQQQQQQLQAQMAQMQQMLAAQQGSMDMRGF
ncbi:uncharacterized protein L203_100275 [Cryptococcus depauperatus CBS 7841]|uniref:Uncharacterized protein n=1 Tax=Cryptococcus depauperatus CBS 7841 TaxID=1295531 RepID=A0A1E3IZ45_9TREE|nr:hypothetical protein L203_00065 [Cryptococcus depauperatus CBS 7841]